MLPSQHRPEVHGHRGCRGLRPENTMPAFLHAVSLGVDVIELDVVISADDQVVVSHEPWLNPLICLDATGQSIPPAEAKRHNLYRLPYAAIQRCDCGQRRHPNYPEQLVEPAVKPLLKDVFAALDTAAFQQKRPPVRYAVELKSTPGGDNILHPEPQRFLSLVLEVLSSASVAARTTFLCFDPRILRVAHHQAPDVATCLLVEDDLPWSTSIRKLGFVPTTFGPDFATVTPQAVQALRTEFPGLRLVPWTVNEPSSLQRCIALGTDGITTDYPDRLIAMLAGR